jgi:hypothetical protein
MEIPQSPSGHSLANRERGERRREGLPQGDPARKAGSQQKLDEERSDAKTRLNMHFKKRTPKLQVHNMFSVLYRFCLYICIDQFVISQCAIL